MTTAREHLDVLGDLPGAWTGAVRYLLAREAEREATPPSDPAPVDVEPGVGAVVRDRHGDRWTRRSGGMWSVKEEFGWSTWADIQKHEGPLTLVSPPTPDAPPAPAPCMCGTPAAKNVDHDRDGCSYIDGYHGGTRLAPQPCGHATRVEGCGGCDPTAGWLNPTTPQPPAGQARDDEGAVERSVPWEALHQAKEDEGAVEALARWDKRGGAVWFDRDEWGLVTDALIDLRASAEARKKGNPESTSDVRAAMCVSMLTRLNTASMSTDGPCTDPATHHPHDECDGARGAVPGYGPTRERDDAAGEVVVQAADLRTCLPIRGDSVTYSDVSVMQAHQRLYASLAAR